jgi:hypothetical protein
LRKESKESKDTHAGEREVKRALRESLIQYQLHLEQELFDRASAISDDITESDLQRMVTSRVTNSTHMLLWPITKGW